MTDQLLSAFGDKMIINPYRYAGGEGLLDGLIAWWSMDETSGTRADSHTGSIDLTDILGGLDSITGKVSNAALFDNNPANDAFLTSTSSALDLGDTDYSFAFWVLRSANGTGTSDLFLSNRHASGSTNYAFFTNASGLFNYQFYDGTGFQAFTGATLGLSAWAHYVITNNSATKTISIIKDDGTPTDGTYPGEAPVTPVSRFALGGNRNGPDTGWVNEFDGLLDEFAVYNRVLTSDEITELYNSGSGIGYPG